MYIDLFHCWLSQCGGIYTLYGLNLNKDLSMSLNPITATIEMKGRWIRRARASFNLYTHDTTCNNCNISNMHEKTAL